MMVQRECLDKKYLSSILHTLNIKKHMTFMFQKRTLKKVIEHEKTIDQESESVIRESQKHWNNVFGSI